GVRAAVHELAQAVGIGPHRHVEQHVFVVERADGGGVAVLGLQAPHEAGRGFGERVDAVEVGGEIRHDGRVHRALDDADVELGELVGGHGGSSGGVCAAQDTQAPGDATPAAALALAAGT